MVQSKGKLFEKDLQETASLYKALGHPARLAILKYLSDIKVCVTGDISEELPLSRTTVNQHLKELKNAGLIQGVVQGTKTNYCLNPEKIRKLNEMSEAFLNSLDTEAGEVC
ncbi:MAG: metalloregulator ArsR/SmtB family transcription factor [Bacteroidales bacterium]|nr:metalloregulator ArsR/SmtB family transcription factor [Bacteroidales bacterium]